MDDKHFFYREYNVVASDMDITYHITPGAILLYFQDCFARYLKSRHAAAFDLLDDNLIWVITDFDLNFAGKRPFWSENIGVNIWIRKTTSLKIFVDYTISAAGGDVFAHGSSCWVLLDLNCRRPVAAKELLERKGIIICGTADPERRFPKTLNEVPFIEACHQVNITDMDFNGHVCNRSYMAIAMSTAPVDFVKRHEPVYVHVKFQKEAFFGDMLKCSVYRQGNEVPVFWHIIRNGEDSDICHVYSEWKDCPEYDNTTVAKEIRR